MLAWFGLDETAAPGAADRILAALAADLAQAGWRLAGAVQHNLDRGADCACDMELVLLAEPESLGAEQITAAGVTMRLQVRSTSADQWRVARELRMRLQERFAAEGIRTPPPLLGAGTATGTGVP